MLFSLWSTETHRPTRDVDLPGFGESDEATLQQTFSDLCRVPVSDDGLLFLADSIRVESIRDATEYGGVGVTLLGYLADARIPVQADFGFGDIVTPEPEQIEYPTLLEYPAPSLQAYPRETVVAEKYQALVNLGIANSRMKDFYDLWIMARQFDFDGVALSQAIQNTFMRRQTSLPAQTPSGLGANFYGDMQKNFQWNAFLRKGMLLSTSTSKPPHSRKCASCWKHFLCRRHKISNYTKPSMNGGSLVVRGSAVSCRNDRLTSRIEFDHENFRS